MGHDLFKLTLIFFYLRYESNTNYLHVLLIVLKGFDSAQRDDIWWHINLYQIHIAPVTNDHTRSLG